MYGDHLLSCNPYFYSRTITNIYSVPQVAISPKDLGMQSRLERALRSLDLSDPAVETAALPSGEHVLRCCGEVHLEVLILLLLLLLLLSLLPVLSLLLMVVVVL